MNIRELKKHKIQLEKDISKLVSEFNNKTKIELAELKVSYIDYDFKSEVTIEVREESTPLFNGVTVSLLIL